MASLGGLGPDPYPGHEGGNTLSAPAEDPSAPAGAVRSMPAPPSLELFQTVLYVGSVTVSAFASQLRTASLRATRPRMAVLAALHEHPHADTETVIDLVRTDIGAVSHQAVYDVLRVLTDAGLVRRIQPAGATARYEARVADNHHHLVCRSCGEISDVDCAVGEAPCLTASDDHGFVVDEAEVVYWGTCPTCATASARE